PFFHLVDWLKYIEKTSCQYMQASFIRNKSTFDRQNYGGVYGQLYFLTLKKCCALIILQTS
ncbi:MAG: hypothetical protein ACOYOA_13770, partial [Saprospiraceae bacterium]